MEHTGKSGARKLVRECSYPLTGVRCVDRIYTDLAVLDVAPNGLVVLEMVEGLAFDELCKLTGVPLKLAEGGAA